MKDTQDDDAAPDELIEAAKDCLRSGRKLAGAIGRFTGISQIRSIRRIHRILPFHRLTQPPAAAIFFESALCITKYLASEFRCDLGVAPARLNVRARARLGRAEVGLDADSM